MEVNKNLSPEQHIKLILFGGIITHEAFECGLFICAEMIDMHIGIFLPDLHNGIYKSFKRLLFFRLIICPQLMIIILVPPSKQIFKTGSADKRITFKIKKYIMS